MAVEVGLDTTAFAQCLRGKAADPGIKASNRQGRRHGIRGTPAFLVADRWVYGAQPLAVFREALGQPDRPASGSPQ